MFWTSSNFLLGRESNLRSAILNLEGAKYSLTDCDVAAGLLAKRALERGLVVEKTVKTSIAPGSKLDDCNFMG